MSCAYALGALTDVRVLGLPQGVLLYDDKQYLSMHVANT